MTSQLLASNAGTPVRQRHRPWFVKGEVDGPGIPADSSFPRGGTTGIRCITARRVGRLLVERLAVTDAALQKLRPGRYQNLGLQFVWQQLPQIGMVPAQRMATAVSMDTDGLAQTFRLREQLLARQSVQVLVHRQARFIAPAWRRPARSHCPRHRPPARRRVCRWPRPPAGRRPCRPC